MPELIVTARELRYAGKRHLKGARFHASDKDAKVLKAIRKAADASAEARPLRKVAETVAAPVIEAPAEAPAALEIPPVADAPRAAAATPYYRTRRLKAED